MAVTNLSEMVGKTLLVRVTYLDHDESIVDQVEFAGIVTSIDPLIAIDHGAGEPFTLPPEPESIHPGIRATTSCTQPARS